MENVGVFYSNFKYFTAIWFNLWPFDIVCGQLVHFSRFGFDREKSGNPAAIDWSKANVFF
jgi:hypothetical protein